MTSRQQGPPPHNTHQSKSEFFKVRVKIPSHLHMRGIRRAGRRAVGRKVAAATCARDRISPVCGNFACHTQSYLLLQSFFMSSSDATQTLERETKGSQVFSALTSLCCRLWKWSMQCLVVLIPQCPVHVLCRPHTTSPICKSSLTTELGTHLLIFQEFQSQVPKALSYGSTVKVAYCFH